MSNKHGKESQSLNRQLNPMHVWAIAFGCIIGWGSFINPGKKFLPNSGVAGTAIAMLLGALVMVIIAFSYAYLVPKYPKAGGEFTFTKNNFGGVAAYICGWFLVAAYLTNVPMNSTAIPLIIEGIFGTSLSLGGISYTIAGSTVTLGGILIASGILILFGVLNLIGVRKAGFVQTVLAILLASCVFVLFASGLIFAVKNGVHFNPMWGFDKELLKESGELNGKTNIAASVLATFAIAPWAFVGFDTIPQAAEEFKFSYKKVMRIMVIAIAFGFFVYTSNNTVCAVVLKNWSELCVEGKWVLLIAAEQLLGIFGKILVGVGVSCAVLSGIMGFYLASSRLMYSMSLEGYLPRTFSKLNRFSVPSNAMIFCIVISLSGPVLGREALGWFVDMSSVGASIGYLFTCLSTVREIRRNKDAKKLVFVMAICGIIFSCSFIFIQLVPLPFLPGVSFCVQSYIMLGIWIFLGLLFYFFKVRDKSGKSD